MVAIGLSALTFVATQLAARRSDEGSYVKKLEAEKKRCEEDRAALIQRNDTLFEENLHLMRKLTRNGKGEGG